MSLIDRDKNYYGDVYLNEHRFIYDYKFSKLKLCCRNICHQAIFYEKRTYKKRKFNLKYRIYADWAYNIESWNDGFDYIPQTICIFSELGNSKNGDNAFAKDKANFIKKNFGFVFYLRYAIFKSFSHIYYFLKHIISSYRYR